MKKLIITILTVIFTMTVYGQTNFQKECYNLSIKYLTENYGTIISEDIDAFNNMIIFAYMPEYYTDTLMKEDLSVFIQTNDNIEIYEDWVYDEELEGIVCFILVDSVQKLCIVYSDEFNLIYFYFSWIGTKE